MLWLAEVVLDDCLECQFDRAVRDGQESKVLQQAKLLRAFCLPCWAYYRTLLCRTRSAVGSRTPDPKEPFHWARAILPRSVRPGGPPCLLSVAANCTIPSIHILFFSPSLTPPNVFAEAKAVKPFWRQGGERSQYEYSTKIRM